MLIVGIEVDLSLSVKVQVNQADELISLISPHMFTFMGLDFSDPSEKGLSGKCLLMLLQPQAPDNKNKINLCTQEHYLSH